MMFILLKILHIQNLFPVSYTHLLTAPSSKFLTITKSEQEKIIEQKNSHKVNKQLKKEEKDEYNSEKYPNTQKAMNTLGEQIYLVIKMKKKNS